MATPIAEPVAALASQGRLQDLAAENSKTTRSIFSGPQERKRRRSDADTLQSTFDESIRMRSEYQNVQSLPPSLVAKQQSAVDARKRKIRPTPSTTGGSNATPSFSSKALVRREAKPQSFLGAPAVGGIEQTGLVRHNSGNPTLRPVRPDWHPPWKLMRVISGHLGWVRSLAVEPGNQWFASGAGDRTIKIWDLASGSLRLTLTGHISTVRGLVVSSRHPYLFSCGEDKMVKCWDLETNKVIRHYHGHLSGVYALSLHPTLDVLVTGGRDGAARVWDMRTRSNIHVLSGHTATVSDVKCQEADPQVISSSLDSTVRMWDLAAGKTMGVLTHHKKGVRALATHPTEFTFATGSTGSIKQWKCPEGAFMQNFEGQNAIINTLDVNHENVLFSGGDNGSMSFWDWKSGHRFQALDTTAQPGSLDAEAGIMTSTFDQTGLRLICGEADKTIKIWKPDPDATPETHPLEWKPTLGRTRI
ncbi:pre-mRNA-splicing factor prp46 [Zalerion maritima]|uniref:Pre-mRNA-splicing factor PRP46 n=1 Tax=Zalerion maritima TaxID=339359 RepID=A0AAD5WSQ5_9PEZI|nr:pre-mRNA-splicing factor prp46 [Zalerion maritima]